MNATNYPEDAWTRLGAALHEMGGRADIPDENGYTAEQKLAACHDILSTSRKEIKNLVRDYHRVFVVSAPGTVVTDDRFYPELRQAAFEWYTNHRIQGLIRFVADLHASTTKTLRADPADFVVTTERRPRLKIEDVLTKSGAGSPEALDALAKWVDAGPQFAEGSKTLLDVWTAKQAGGLASTPIRP